MTQVKYAFQDSGDDREPAKELSFGQMTVSPYRDNYSYTSSPSGSRDSFWGGKTCKLASE